MEEMEPRETKDQREHPVIRDLWDLSRPRGAQGNQGAKGEQGVQGAKGEHGGQAIQKNWKQCAWKNINDGRDSGLIKVQEIVT